MSSSPRRLATMPLRLALLLCVGAGLGAPGGMGAEADPGLAWVRFNSPVFSQARDTGNAECIDVDTGTAFNDYSQVWVGLIELPPSQRVTFSAEADDGLRLRLDQVTVIEGWSLGSSRQGTFQAPVGGRVSLRLEYFQNGGTGHLRLYWQWPGHERELIPATAFSHTARQQEYVEHVFNGQEAPLMYEDRSMIYQPERGIPGAVAEAESPLPAQPGPHLLLDDYLIAASHGVRRVVLPPRRDPALPNPLITGPTDRCMQPFFSVLRDASSGRSRIWYGAWREDRSTGRTQLATMDSPDGIHFIRPHRLCATPEIQFGSSVLDRGATHPEAATRYIYSYWLEGGTRLLASADGFAWKPLVEGVVLPHDHDITGLSWDPLRQTYVATVSTYTTGAAWTGQRRTTLMSFSPDLQRWQTPWVVLAASSALDAGETQFYAMDGYLTRGSLRLGMVKVLRDDLVATATAPGSFGRAHTALAWSRDGRTWVRDRAAFFEPDDDPNAWDHAHAWIDEQVQVGDEIYLYYGGYKQGHKVNRFDERQIGLVRMPLDRYVARRAEGDMPGRLRTVPFLLAPAPAALRVNATAAAGALRVAVQDARSGATLPGFSFSDCEPIRADGLRLPVRWRQADLGTLAGETVRFEFELTRADLFGFDLRP